MGVVGAAGVAGAAGAGSRPRLREPRGRRTRSSWVGPASSFWPVLGQMAGPPHSPAPGSESGLAVTRLTWRGRLCAQVAEGGPRGLRGRMAGGGQPWSGSCPATDSPPAAGVTAATADLPETWLRHRGAKRLLQKAGKWRLARCGRHPRGPGGGCAGREELSWHRPGRRGARGQGRAPGRRPLGALGHRDTGEGPGTWVARGVCRCAAPAGRPAR